MLLLTTNFVKNSHIQVRNFFYLFKKCSKSNLKCFYYQISMPVKRSEKQLSIKGSFCPFFQLNCPNYRLKQCRKPQTYQNCQRKWVWDELGSRKVFQRQSVAKYLRLTLVFMKNRAPQEKFNCYFLELFCQYQQKFYFGRGAGHKAIIL